MQGLISKIFNGPIIKNKTKQSNRYCILRQQEFSPNSVRLSLKRSHDPTLLQIHFYFYAFALHIKPAILKHKNKRDARIQYNRIFEIGFNLSNKIFSGFNSNYCLFYSTPFGVHLHLQLLAKTTTVSLVSIET